MIWPRKGVNRRLEFDLGARFEGSCGFALVLALSQMMEHGLGPFGRADLHPRRNPLDRQGRFAPQPGSDGQLAGVAAPARSGVYQFSLLTLMLENHLRAAPRSHPHPGNAEG